MICFYWISKKNSSLTNLHLIPCSSFSIFIKSHTHTHTLALYLCVCVCACVLINRHNIKCLGGHIATSYHMLKGTSLNETSFSCLPLIPLPLNVLFSQTLTYFGSSRLITIFFFSYSNIVHSNKVNQASSFHCFAYRDIWQKLTPHCILITIRQCVLTQK